MIASTSHGHEGSPIPYLLAGIAAMLALTGVSLFILACSYWKFAGYNGAFLVQQQQQQQQQQQVSSSSSHNINTIIQNDVEASSSKSIQPLHPCPPNQVSCRFVVIMAGHNIPTFLAQPMAKVDHA